MRRIFDEYSIYEFSDEDIVKELCGRLKDVRRGCCYSQQDLSNLSGVSIASIKRIETGALNDINVGTLIKLMRTTGVLEGFSKLIPDVPESPFLLSRSGETQRKKCRKSYRRLGNEK